MGLGIQSKLQSLQPVFSAVVLCDLVKTLPHVTKLSLRCKNFSITNILLVLIVSLALLAKARREREIVMHLIKLPFIMDDSGFWN